MRYKDLLNTSDILHLLTNKLNLAPKQKGRSVFFLCPFHSDKNPSCSFEPNRKIFTCFTCGFKASDIFNFWAQYKKISLEAAAEEISQMGYFPPEILQEQQKEAQKGKNKNFYLLSLITDIYQHNLFTQPGREVLNYLQNERQLDKKTIDCFNLGCSINNWQLSNLFFSQKNDNFSSEDLLTTNLVLITENNRTCDFFSAQHLIIPLTNPEGKVVAFAARKVGEIPSGEGKYKYLPSYQSYQKSALLYNYSVVKKNPVEECYLVEGFFDVISLNKLGIENCVALLGTNLSEEQIRLLTALKKRIVFFLDSDKAGQEATINGAVKLLKREVDCEIIKNDYPGDPDEICRQKGKEEIQTILHHRENPYLFILNHHFNKWEVRENPQRTSHFIGKIAEIFRNFKPHAYEFIITKISSLINWARAEIEPHFIQWNFPTFHIRYLQNIYGQELIEKKEQKIIYLCAQERHFWLLASEKIHFFSTPVHRTKYSNLYNYYISSFSHRSYLKSHPTNELSDNYGLSSTPYHQKEKIIDMMIQEIEIVKKILLKNYD